MINSNNTSELTSSDSSPYVLVVGNAQDGGYPHTGCNKPCCNSQWDKPREFQEYVSCLCLIIPESNNVFFFDCTPDFKHQLRIVSTLNSTNSHVSMDIGGIFLTHAHYGHYTGLLQLGREVMGKSNIPVYAYPKMANLITNNAPFSQLVTLNNVKINILNQKDNKIDLEGGISVESFLVKHRGEFSETCGFRIKGRNKSLVFIPDIDSIEGLDIISLIKENDYLFIDGTFYSEKEVNFRDVKEIPHPFVKSSIEYLESVLDKNNNEREKVHFIHLNHSNPLWDKNSQEYREVIEKGFKISKQMQKITL